MKVLEELWFGNIDSTEYDSNAGEEYEELRELIRRNDEKLQAIMTDEIHRNLQYRYRRYDISHDATSFWQHTPYQRDSQISSCITHC